MSTYLFINKLEKIHYFIESIKVNT